MTATICKPFFCFLLVLSLTPHGAFAQTTTWPTDWQTYVPTSWTWAAAAWKNADGQSGGATLRDQMTVDFLGDWVNQDKRVLSGREIGLLRDSALRQARLTLDKALTQFRLQQAQARLTSTAPPDDSTLKNWNSNDQTWNYFHEHRDQIPLPNPMPLKLSAPSDGSFVTPTDETDPSSIVSRLNVDLLFWGDLASEGKIWTLTIGLWSRLENRNLLVWTDHFLPAEAKQRIDKAHEAFEELFLGRPWAALIVDGEPSDILFRANGAVSGTPLVLDGLEPGEIDVEAEAPGYLNQKKTYILNAGKTVRDRVKLKSAAEPGPLIDSLPEGANVWVDSRWVGVTPIRIDKPLSRERLRVELAGYEPALVDLDPNAEDRKFLLTPPLPKPDIAGAKDRFYFSLAVFSFSLTTTIFAHALSDQWAALTNNYANQYIQTPTNQIYDNYVEAYRWQQGFLYASYGGLALTTGVFVWMMVELSAYIHEAEPR